MRDDILKHKELIMEMIKNNEPKAEMCRIFSCKHDTLNRALSKMGIEYKGNPSMKGKTKPCQNVHVSEYLGTGKRIPSHELKLKLIRDGIFEHQCSECKNTEWNGKPIPLELDHIDGVHHNNELSNLRLLCPNCHAQTDTYRGKNIKKKKEILEYMPSLEDNIEDVKSLPKFKTRQKILDIIQLCKRCKKEFHSKRMQIHCSNECSHASQNKSDISSEKLRELIWTYPITKVATILGISDVAVHKRCKKFGIEKPKQGHWLKPENKTSK